jgi:XRE family transcriptional regulator, regulator of sulfur utilization
MESMAKTFGKRVKSYRRKRGLTQEELARLAQIDSKYIGSIERGERAPSFEVAERLSKALKVDYHALFLPDRLSMGSMQDAANVLLKDIQRIDPRLFAGFFSDLLAALRRLDRTIDERGSDR